MGLSTDAYLYYGFDIDHRIVQREDDVYMYLCGKASFCGLDLDFHCSGQFPIYFVHAKMYAASRGYPEKIITLEVDETWNAKFKNFCQLIGHEYIEPDWLLASYIGGA